MYRNSEQVVTHRIGIRNCHVMVRVVISISIRGSVALDPRRKLERKRKRLTAILSAA